MQINGTAKKQDFVERKLTMLLNIHADYKLVSYEPFYGVVIYVNPYGTPHQLTKYTDSIGLQTGIFTSIQFELTQVCFTVT